MTTLSNSVFIPHQKFIVNIQQLFENKCGDRLMTRNANYRGVIDNDLYEDLSYLCLKFIL